MLARSSRQAPAREWFLGVFKVTGGPILGAVCGLGVSIGGGEHPMMVLRHCLAIAGIITATASARVSVSRTSMHQCDGDVGQC